MRRYMMAPYLRNAHTEDAKSLGFTAARPSLTLSQFEIRLAGGWRAQEGRCTGQDTGGSAQPSVRT